MKTNTEKTLLHAHPQEEGWKGVENTFALKSILPVKHSIPNNKLANVITDGVINAGKIELATHGGIKTSCIVATVPHEGVHICNAENMTEYDRNVYNGIVSLFLYGDTQHVMTPAMIFRAMTGQTNTEHPTSAQLESIRNSVDKMRFTRVYIDVTDELRNKPAAQQWGKKVRGKDGMQEERLIIDTYLLAADGATVTAGGETVSAYQVLKTPVLYEYARLAGKKDGGQVLTIPSNLLNIKKIGKDGKPTTRSLPNTEQRIVIRGYLVRRIEGMKGNNNLHSDNIALQGIYAAVGVKNPDKKKAMSIRNDVEAVLDFWKAEGYINNHEPYKKGKTFAGYTIAL